MKSLRLVLLLLAGAALLWIGLRAPEPTYRPEVRAEDVPVTLATDVPAGFELREYAVSGMCCQSCASKLHSAVTELPDVRAAAVDSVLGKVQVFARAGAPNEPILSALTFDDYSAEPAR